MAPVLHTDAAAAPIQCSAILGERLQSTAGFAPFLPRLQLCSVQETQYEGLLLQLFLVFFTAGEKWAQLLWKSMQAQPSPTKAWHIPHFRSTAEHQTKNTCCTFPVPRESGHIVII